MEPRRIQEKTIADKIENLIKISIETWHEVTKAKGLDGTLREEAEEIPAEERVKVAFKVRDLNGERSKARWEIDKHFGTGADESKVNVSGE
jgi:hypothetical protein